MTPAQPQLEIAGSRQFTSWLLEQRLSLAFTTYQTGKLFLIGLKPDGKMSVFERTFDRCMGLAVTDATEIRNSPQRATRGQAFKLETRNGAAQTLWMSSLYQLWRLKMRFLRANRRMVTTGFTCRNAASPPATWTRMTWRSMPISGRFS